MFARADNYRVNDKAVDALFKNAVEMTSPLMSNLSTEITTGLNGTMSLSAGEKNPAVAFLLAWFLGYLGVHRLYLGTETIVFIGYLCTGGGCGVVATVDWIVLLIGLINDDIDKYIDNPKFFMWL